MMASGTNAKWRVEPWLGGAALILLFAGSATVLRPFFSAIVWAVIIAYTLSPLQRVFTKWFRGSRTLAACAVSLLVVLLFAGPLVLIGVSLAQDGKELARASSDWAKSVPLDPPEWVTKLPLIGDELATNMSQIAEDRQRWLEQLDREVKNAPRAQLVEESNGEMFVRENPEAREESAIVGEGETAGDGEERSPHAVVLLGRFLSWARTGLIEAGKSVGQGLAQSLFSAFLAFFFLRDAPVLSQRLRVVVGRVAGDRGKHLIKVAGDTVRGVVLGVMGTALAQGVVAWLGFWFAGVPGAVLLGVLTFFFAVVPFGPPLIWGPASVWLFAQGRPGMGIFMAIYGLLGISSVDNILKPYLISHGSKMPFALMLCGVVGGVLSLGLAGVFLGPTLLAVSYRLIDQWSSEAAGTSTQDGPIVVDRA